MKHFVSLAAAAALFAASPAWAVTTIDFEGYAPGLQANPIVDSGATFSGPDGLFVFDFIETGNQQLCSTSGPDCSLALDVEFATAVSGLSFLAAADDSASTLSVWLTLADLSTTLATFTLDGNVFSYDTIDLSSYGNIRGLSITSNDELGVVYDDFTYSTAVPEPSTWLMLILGFGIMGSAVRRRRVASASLA
jgi:hypothetical protein